MDNQKKSFEDTLISNSYVLQIGWSFVLVVSLANHFVNELHLFAHYPLDLKFTLNDIFSIVIHFVTWLLGVMSIKYFVGAINQKINDQETLVSAYKESDTRYRKLFNQMNHGFAVHEIILDQGGKPCDYRFLEVNKAFEVITGLEASQLIGKTVLEILPNTEYSWIEKYGNVALGGNAIQFEDYSRELDCWYSVSAYSPKAGQFAVLVQDVTERDKTAESLREYQYVIENSRDMIVSLDSQHRYQMANKRFLDIRELSLDDVIGKTPEEVLGTAVYLKMVKPNLERAFKGESVKYLLNFNTNSGEERKLEVTYQPMLKEDGTVKRVFGFIIDITEKLDLEEQLRQSQRMESIGTLAGGVAHDFNNILTVIMGAGTYLQMELADNTELEPFATQIVSSSERAAHLTQSLLAFSRKQTIQVEIIDLNDIVAIIRDFLGSIIGENLNLDITMSASPQLICADRGQIEQVLMNLVVNARDAMPDGGNVVISTTSVQSACIPELEGHNPGDYVLLTVSDTGHGMSDKIRSRIFEPFFTTKDVGQGTGLGLSVVYGIVAQHEGLITVDSEPGAGSTFKVYLPIANKCVPAFESEPSTELPGGDETILLVEDNDEVRFINRIILKNRGYTVLEASNSEEALHILHHQGESVSLAILDIMMPGMNGKELADLCTSFLPNLRVLFITGYGTESLGKKGIVTEQINLLRKPLNLGNFLSKVRELIDSSSPSVHLS